MQPSPQVESEGQNKNEKQLVMDQKAYELNELTN